MSVIQKQPFIEKVIASLSDEEKVALVSLINGSDLEPSFKSLVNKTYNITASDKGVSHIMLETIERTYTGYLLYTDSYCVLVSYKNIQELVILNINPSKNTSEIVKEPLSITELRFELGAGGSGGGAGLEVVELTGLSGTLSDGDYTKLSGENCLLKLGTQYYRLNFNASTLIIYQAFSRQAGQDQALFDYVEITKADKSWELKADNIVEGNPTVPSGTTPTDLTNLKVGNTYYKTGIPTVTIALSQVTSQDPLQVQLTNEQYAIVENNKQVLLDLSALGQTSVVWQYFDENSDYIYYGFADMSSDNKYFNIVIDKSSKEATYYTDEKNDAYADGVTLEGDGDQYIYGALSLTGNLPYLTTAPQADNTSGYLKIVVLSSEPATYYNGYLYLILDSQV